MTVKDPVKGQSFETLSDEELEAQLNAGEPQETEEPAEAEPEADGKPEAEPEAETEVEETTKGIDTKQSVESLQKQLKNLQDLYGRQSNELGELRKQLKEKPTQEDFDADPVKATEQLQEHKEELAKIKKLEKEQAVQQQVMQNIQFAQQFSPDLEANAKTIFELVTEVDKATPQDANKLLSNVYLQDPWGVFQLNQRAKLHNENKQLRAEIEKIKKTSKTTIDKIAGINSITPEVSASTGQASPKTPAMVNPNDLAKLSDQDLEAQIEAQLLQEK